MIITVALVTIGGAGDYVYHRDQGVRQVTISKSAKMRSSADSSNAPPTKATAQQNTSSLQAVVSASRASIVKIEGYYGCLDILWGTGFVVGPGLVATDAHVIAGITDPTVIDSAGVHAATPVVFDPGLDFAVLRVSGLAGAPLPLDANTIGLSVLGGQDGDHDVVLGYPNTSLSSSLSTDSALVVSELNNDGPDIYGQTGTTVPLLQLTASGIAPGSSGSPLVETDGKVAGIINGVAPDDSSTAYAVPSQAFYNDVQQAKTSTAASTQSCTQESSE